MGPKGDHDPLERSRVEQCVDRRGRGIGTDKLPARRTHGVSDPREQQSQVVVNLGRGCHRRPRAARWYLLLYGDRRADAFDGVDGRLLHALEELARVGGQRLDVATLPLGVQGVEGKARLARARDTGNHHQPLAGYVDVDALEVVHPGAADRDRLARSYGGFGDASSGHDPASRKKKRSRRPPYPPVEASACD